MESQLTQALSIVRANVRDWQCSLLSDKYQLSEVQLGRGTYGSVYKAKNILNDRFYALKKMEHIEDKNQFGFPITTLREIKLLQGLKHPNILNINEVVYEKSRNHRPPVLYLCLDLMDCDLDSIIKNKQIDITPSKIQQILKQILQALQYLQTLNIAHRDIKPSNVLINEHGDVKLADFGLAKKLRKLSTVKVVTLWYRAPQLLLGIRGYSPKVDVWSVGCLAAELLLKRPLFEQQKNETELMKRIFQLMGTPDNCGWEDELAQEGKNYPQLKPDFSCSSTIIYHLRQLAFQFENEFQMLDLIEKMLRLNHQSRLTASECLEHPFFKNEYPAESLLASAEKKKQVNEYDQNMRKFRKA